MTKTTTVKASVLSFTCESSSNVVGAKYFEEAGNPQVDEHPMIITFKGGDYEYSNIPRSVWEAFKAADSKGNFVNTAIVGPDRKNPIYKGVKVVA